MSNLIKTRRYLTERRALQLAVFILAGVPLAAGLDGMIFGAAMVQDSPIDISLDSHLRYLSGLLFAIGLCFLTTIPSIENKATRFRLLTFIVFTGGLARLAGIFLAGWPSEAMLFGLGMELVITPLLCLWQMRVSRMHRLRSGD